MDVIAICLVAWFATILILSKNDDDDDHFDGGYHIHVHPRHTCMRDYESEYHRQRA